MPAEGADGVFVTEVAVPVAFDFRGPPDGTSLRYSENGTVMMPVPEAAMDEDAGFVFGKDNIGLAREEFIFRTVYSKPVAEPVEHGAQSQLGLRVASPDAGHDL